MNIDTSYGIKKSGIWDEGEEVIDAWYGDKSISIENNDAREVFRTTDVGIGMAEMLMGLKTQDKIHGILVDNGCGSGVLGHVGSMLTDNTIVFHDVSHEALYQAMNMSEKNNIYTRSKFRHGMDLFSDEYDNRVGCIVSNLPQNPEWAICRDGGAMLQIVETIRLKEILANTGIIITKSVDYADSAVEGVPEIEGEFNIQKIGTKRCTNPNNLSPASVDYYTLSI